MKFTEEKVVTKGKQLAEVNALPQPPPEIIADLLMKLQEEQEDMQGEVTEGQEDMRGEVTEGQEDMRGEVTEGQEDMRGEVTEGH